MPEASKATWNDASKDYQSVVGAISIPSAHELVNMTTRVKPFDNTSHILDLGCGSGAITLAVLLNNHSTNIKAIDTSTKMREELETNVTKAGHESPNLQTALVDLNTIRDTYKPYTFTHIFASYVLHIASPSFSTSASSIHSLLYSSGIFALATFTPSSDTFFIWDRACRIYDPSHTQPAFAPDLHACITHHDVVQGMQAAGFEDVHAVVRRAPFPIHTTEGWVGFFFEWRNPVCEGLMGPFHFDAWCE